MHHCMRYDHACCMMGMHDDHACNGARNQPLLLSSRGCTHRHDSEACHCRVPRGGNASSKRGPTRLYKGPRAEKSRSVRQAHAEKPEMRREPTSNSQLENALGSSSSLTEQCGGHWRDKRQAKAPTQTEPTAAKYTKEGGGGDERRTGHRNRLEPTLGQGLPSGWRPIWDAHGTSHGTSLDPRHVAWDIPWDLLWDAPWEYPWNVPWDVPWDNPWEYTWDVSWDALCCSGWCLSS